MSQAPSMPIFVDAYLADTTHLSHEENSVYLLLLMAMWRRGGSVPDDDKDNARVCRLTVGRWRKVKSRLLPLLTLGEGEITQKRLKKEWVFVSQKREKLAENGRLGGRKNKYLAEANGQADLKPNESTQSQPHSHIEDTSSLRSDVARSDPSSSPPPQSEEPELPECLRRGPPIAEVRALPAAPRRKNGTALPEDFPTVAQRRDAIDFWKSKDRSDLAETIDDQAAQFRDYHTAKGTASKDWPASWRTWARNALNFTRKTNGSSKPSSAHTRFIDGIGEYIADVRAAAEPVR